MFKKALLFILLILSLFLSGCWDKRELTELAFIQVLGLDLAENNRDFRVSCLIADAAKSNPDEPINLTCIIAEAPSIYEAFNIVNSGINRELTLLQNQAIIINEKLASRGFAYWNQELSHFQDLRRTCMIFFCKDAAEKILQATPKLESDFGEHLFDLPQLSGSHYILPGTTLHEFTKRDMLKISGFNYGNYLEYSDGSAILAGMLIFKDNIPVGTLNLEDSQLLSFFRGEKKATFIGIKDPTQSHQKLFFHIFGKNFSFKKMEYSPKENLFTLSLNITAALEEPQKHQRKKRLEKTEFYLNSALQKRFTSLIEKSQKVFKCDIFNFGSHLRRYVLTDADWGKYKWSEKYPTIKIQFNIKTSWRN